MSGRPVAVERVGVVVHGASDSLGRALVGAVARDGALGDVRAVEVVGRRDAITPAAARLGEVCDVVVGLGALPFPDLALRHDASRDALDGVPYWGVETWHGLPGFHDALAAAIGDAPAEGASVLLTGPDDVVRTLPPEHRVVLRDVAAALHERTGARPTIAVDRSPLTGAVTPTAVDALTTLVEAHGVADVVRCSLVPDDAPDAAVTAAARSLGARLRDVAIDRSTHVRLLVEVVRTLLVEALAPGPVGPGEPQP